MKRIAKRIPFGLLRLLVVAGANGCVLAAAGAGAGAGIYVTDRGAESLVAAPVARTFEASRAAFQELGITETRTITDSEGGAEKRTLQGKTADREIEVELKSEGASTRVGVVAKKTAVTWDKDLARKLLGEIVERSK